MDALNRVIHTEKVSFGNLKYVFGFSHNHLFPSPTSPNLSGRIQLRLARGCLEGNAIVSGL